ncbi:MAG: hypothetical protein ACP5DX_04065 [Paracoccaceae bacterium]
MTVQRQYQSRFAPGDRVIVGDDIMGVVERVIFARNMTHPLIAVEWWDRSSLQVREFHEDEVRFRDQQERFDD